MASQGRSIEAVVTLDLKPFQTKISEINTLLKELGNGINIDFGASKLAHQMDDLKRILRGVGEEAEKITTAFNKIEGMSRLLESLSQVKSKLEYIQNDIDKINASVIKVDESTNKISATENKLNNIMNNGLKTVQNTNAQLRRTSKEVQGLLTVHKGVTDYLLNEDKITRMSLRTIQEQDRILADKLAKSERETALAREIAEINKLDMDIRRASANAEAEMLAFLESESGVISSITGSREKGLSVINEELSLEKEKMALIEEETALINEQNAVKQKGAVTGANGGKNQLDKMGYLPSRIGSMALTMWGFNELMDVYDKTMGHINAESQKDYFAKRMGMNSKATQDFTNQLNNMQKTYKKLDMTVVGANALETATKYKVQESSLGDLTEVMAIYGSEFVKQGRSQEDSILAINDALDGELRRLKEVGIGAEELEATGLWNGDESDKEGMLKALLQIAQERGYDKTAKDITNLSDAITTLEVKLSIDLARAFGVIEPLITDVLGNFVTMLEALEGAIAWVTPKITEFAKALGLIDKDGNGTQFGNFLEDWASWMITFGITAYGVYKIIKPLVGWLKKLRGATDDVAKTTGDIGNDVGKTMNTGGFKENFKSEWGKLGKNLGKMARVFVEFAVALAMAWALIEEAIILISAIGYTYDSLKPQFDSGIEFIKEFGLWFALLGGAMLVLSYALDKVPDSAIESVTKGATKLAYGMAIAMGLIAEAIGLLILPLGAIIVLGATYNWQQSNVESGLKVIKGVGTVLNTIASDDSIMVFLLGFMAVSAIMAFGGAELIALPLAIGMAVTMGLIAEAIGLLILPLGAIALLGYTANSLNEADIQQGAEIIKLVGRVLKVLSEAMVDLFVVDIATLGIMLTEKASQLLTGKTGLQALTDDIIPSLTDFIKDFNGLEMGEPVDQAKVQAIQQMATDIPPLFQAIQKVNNALGTSDAVGNIFGALGGGISGAIGMGLSSKLDQLYNDVRDVMNFANKLGGLSTANGGANANAITQTANAIAQLKVKLNLLITTISSASSRVQSASQRLGNALPTGFRTGSASFNSTVVSTLAKGISAVQSRYGTWLSGGKASAQKLTDGFKTFGGKLKSTITTEMGYALRTLDSYQDDFYRKGQALGKQLSDGFESSGGLNVGSPANIARTIAKEMEYSMLALDTGKQMMYKGGQALGRALTNGYNSYGNLRTDVGVLAQKGVNSEQLQANAKNTQLNGNQKGQTPQLTQTNINIDMSNSTVIGVQDLDNKIRQAVEKAIVSMNSPNGAIGY